MLQIQLLITCTVKGTVNCYCQNIAWLTSLIRPFETVSSLQKSSTSNFMQKNKHAWLYLLFWGVWRMNYQGEVPVLKTGKEIEEVEEVLNMQFGWEKWMHTEFCWNMTIWKTARRITWILKENELRMWTRLNWLLSEPLTGCRFCFQRAVSQSVVVLVHPDLYTLQTWSLLHSSNAELLSLVQSHTF